MRVLSLRLAFIGSVVFAAFAVNAQSTEKLVQFSGVVLDGDSLSPVPYAAVIVTATGRGTITDYYGYFSFVAAQGDTIEFSSVGYRKERFVIPDTLVVSNRYSLIQLMTSDTVELHEFEVYPWPSKDQFKEAFLNLQLPSDDWLRAEANLSDEKMRYLMRTLPMADGSINFKYMQYYNRNSQMYATGQFPTWSILNPLAWAQFIDSWKRGDFRRQ